jgi:hypothetical protein
LASNHVFWYGVLLACLIVWILPGWAGAVFFVVALIASDLLSSIFGHGHVSTSAVAMLILLAIGLVVGISLGRRRGLRLLGEAEFRTRWTNILKINRWI